MPPRSCVRNNGVKKASDSARMPVTTRKQKDEARERGDIRGWIGLQSAKQAVGRPKKALPLSGADDDNNAKQQEAEKKRSAEVYESVITTSKKARGQYDQWRNPDMFLLLKAAVIDACTANACSKDLLLSTRIPRTTVGRHTAAFISAGKEHNIPLSDVTLDMIFPVKEVGGWAPLLTDEDCKFLEEIAISRDLRNNGMTRAEIITMVMELSQCCGSRKQAENHFDYLIRNGRFSGLKRGGRVVVAQKTTMKRSQITIEQLLRWHTAVDFALAEQRRLNLPAEDFNDIKEHFFLNMDESSLLASDGTVRVVGSATKSKTEKIMDDCRASITVLRTGAAGGFSGPWIFLAAGKKYGCHPSLKKIDNKPGVPPYSKVFMTPTAYMTDSVYAEIAPELAAGIRKMPHICEHPDWWVVVSLDGFGSHVNVHEAQQAFYDKKIMILKEEGDTSHLNQAYDQSVAKNDKAGMRMYLDLIRPHIGVRLDQWFLIGVAIEALKKIKASAWIESFKKVNLHPVHRVPFDVWLKKIDSTLSGGEFFASRTSLFDAMPVMWKSMSVEDRHAVVSIIDSFYNDTALEGQLVWTTQNVLRLVKYVPLADVGKLRCCYLAAKRDPSVFVIDNGGALVCSPPLVDSSRNTNQTSNDEDQSSLDTIFSWKPVAIIKKYKEARTDRTNQVTFFHHITNFVARQESGKSRILVPSAYLNVEITDEQVELLKPSVKHVLMGAILAEAAGKGARKLIAKRRIDMIDGNIGSYSRLLISDARMEMIRDVNALAAAVAEISKEKLDARDRLKETADQKALKKAEKQKAAELTDEAHRSEVMPILTELMGRFETADNDNNLEDGIKALSANVLKDILKYYYTVKIKGMSTMKKPDLVMAVITQFIALRDGPTVV
ncbi:hypothetical protein MHU86_15980 [Fragilaria crotonensis]|nr:hypothetical protein MHU86_15980 [Fragilaria crotonensis]